MRKSKEKINFTVAELRDLQRKVIDREIDNPTIVRDLKVQGLRAKIGPRKISLQADMGREGVTTLNEVTNNSKASLIKEVREMVTRMKSAIKKQKLEERMINSLDGDHLTVKQLLTKYVNKDNDTNGKYYSNNENYKRIFVNFEECPKEAENRRIHEKSGEHIKKFCILDKKVKDLKKSDIEHWRDHCHVKEDSDPDFGVSETTKKRTYNSLRASLNHCVDREIITQHNIGKVKFSSNQKAKYRPIPEADLEKIYDAVAEFSERNKMIFKLLIGTGARISEVLSLKIQDFNPEQQRIQVYKSYKDEKTQKVILSKTNKSRKLEMSSDLRDALLDFIQNEHDGAKEGYLFLATKRYAGNRLKSWRSPWATLCKHAGISANTYDMRKTFAENLALANVPINKIRDFLGHHSIAQTDAYLRDILGDNRGYLDDAMNDLDSKLRQL